MHRLIKKSGGKGMLLERVGEDINSLRIVSKAYAGKEGELTSVLQYVYQAVLLGERGEKRIAGVLMEIGAAEMRHLQTMGSLITRLGAPPVFTACPPYPVSYYTASCVNYAKETDEMLRADIEAEKASVASYCKMLLALKNPAVTEVIAGILEEERAHLAALCAL